MQTTKEKQQSRAVVVDLDRCLSCRSCEMACEKAHAGHEDIVEAVLSGVRLTPRVRVIAAAGKGVPIQCQHCEDAPCVSVCPTDAIYKDEETGKTLTAPERCIGCKRCIVACPFGALEWDGDSRAILKCDLCEGLVEEGEQPRCVAACPTHARKVVKLEEVTSDRRRAVAQETVAQFSRESEEPQSE